MERERLDRLARQVLDAAHRVNRNLGVGFLERVYENALAWELRSEGLAIGQQVEMTVNYQGHAIGHYFADIVVDDALIVELKTASGIAREHRMQVLNYLRASNHRLGFVLNFGACRLDIARVVNRF